MKVLYIIYKQLFKILNFFYKYNFIIKFPIRKIILIITVLPPSKNNSNLLE